MVSNSTVTKFSQLIKLGSTVVMQTSKGNLTLLSIIKKVMMIVNFYIKCTCKYPNTLQIAIHQHQQDGRISEN